MAVGGEECIALSKDVEALQDRVEKVEGKVEDSILRITAVEMTGARHDEKFIALCSKMDEVMASLKEWMEFAQALFWKVMGAAGIIIGILVAFFMWYIQSLPRV